MNSTFTSALARALPSVGRQCQPRVSFLRQIRPFSSSQAAMDPKTKARELERQLLNKQPEASTEQDSSLASLTKIMRGDKRGVSLDYSRMAESLEAEMIKRPYADRSPPHHLHVYAHKHNTLLTLTRPNGNPMLSMSCGHLGFRKAGRSGYDPAYQLTSHVFGQMQERGFLAEIQRLEVILRGFGNGREAFTKVLLGHEGKHIRGLVSRVADSTRIKFGGTRSRKVRRLG